MSSFWQRWSHDASHALSDWYGNCVWGDDAGDSIRLVILLTPRMMTTTTTTPTSSSSSSRRKQRQSSSGNNNIVQWGFTTCDIAGKAYIQNVTENSPAAQQGMQPQDCVQYAALLSDEWDNDDNDNDNDNDKDFPVQEIQQQALHRESQGQRISYHEFQLLVKLGATCSLITTKQRPIPTTIRCGTTPQAAAGSSSVNDNDNANANANHTNMNTNSDLDESTIATNTQQQQQQQQAAGGPRPVVLVLRRTMQRPSSTSFRAWPLLRLDDECDVAVHLLQALTSPEALSAASSSASSSSSASIEATTIRSMIPKAYGLAFLTTHKMTMGVSVHAGSGIVIARLPNGNWSAPSAIGICGLGLGLSLGVEMAECLMILQTPQALKHFQSSQAFAIGGANLGMAVATLGRQAMGAASCLAAPSSSSSSLSLSLSDQPLLCGMSLAFHDGANHRKPMEDEYYTDDDSLLIQEGGGGGDNDDAIHGAIHHPPSSVVTTPIVAYAKSQGLYVGISLEGSRIFPRNDLNARTYQFYANHHHPKKQQQQVTAKEILQGKIPFIPQEAKPLYETLHQLEYAQELQEVVLPQIITMMKQKTKPQTPITCWKATEPPLPLHPELCKTTLPFLMGGLPVVRLDNNGSHRLRRRHHRQPRTLWLYQQPNTKGNLVLGYISRRCRRRPPPPHNNNNNTENPTTSNINNNNDALLSKQPIINDQSTVASEEVTLDSALLIDTHTINNKGISLPPQESQTIELSNKHQISLTEITSIHQELPANNNYNNNNNMMMIDGEDEDFTTVEELRQVVVVESSSGQSFVFLAPSVQEAQMMITALVYLVESECAKYHIRGGVGGKKKSALKQKGHQNNNHKKTVAVSLEQQDADSGYSSSDLEDDDDDDDDAYDERTICFDAPPSRGFLKSQARIVPTPTYVHGQLLIREICKNVHLPLPLPLCRVLLLDSSSPLITKWQNDQKASLDLLETTPWTFPPATPTRPFFNEHQLIASGSMCGAHRTVSYQRRSQKFSTIRQSETHIVESDDNEKLLFHVNERMPRRGFSIKVKIVLRGYNNECEATVLGEIRPVGKNMSNPKAVHKAFELVVTELKQRYGANDQGLLAAFMSVVDTFQNEASTNGTTSYSRPSHFPPTRWDNHKPTSNEEKKESEHSTGVVKFEDMLNANQNLGNDDADDPLVEHRNRLDLRYGNQRKASSPRISKRTKEEDTLGPAAAVSTTIEVKPLPKIRLSLMPSPREEDEFNLDEDGEFNRKKKSNKSSSSSKKSSRSSSSRWKKKKRSRGTSTP